MCSNHQYHDTVPQASTSNRLLKRVLAYIFLISIVCVFSSGLSILSSGIFQWIGKTRRSRASKQLPVAKYEKNLQRTLLQHLLETEYVIDRISMADIVEHHAEEQQEPTSDRPDAASRARSASNDSANSDAEICSICLDDFENGADIKVCRQPCVRACLWRWCSQIVVVCRSCHASTFSTWTVSTRGSNVGVDVAHSASKTRSLPVRPRLCSDSTIECLTDPMNQLEQLPAQPSGYSASLCRGSTRSCNRSRLVGVGTAIVPVVVLTNASCVYWSVGSHVLADAPRQLH